MKWLRPSLSFEKLTIYLLLIFFALLFLLPTFVAINTAFKPRFACFSSYVDFDLYRIPGRLSSLPI